MRMNWKKTIILTLFSMIDLIINCCFIGNRLGDESPSVSTLYRTKLEIKNETNLDIDLYLNNEFLCSSSPGTNIEFRVSRIYQHPLGSTQNLPEEDREIIEREANKFSISYIKHTIKNKAIEGYNDINLLEGINEDLLFIEARSFAFNKTIFNDTLTLPLYPLKAIHTIYIR